MDGRLRGGTVLVGGDARNRFHDARGYGRPADGELALAPVEAAHLLYRGDLDAVLVERDGGADRLGFRGFLAAGGAGFVPRFLVYKDLRDRGFYLAPAAPPDVTDGDAFAGRRGDGHDFVVFPRGKGPWDDEVRYRVRAVGERATVPAAALGDVVVAVVDEESEITYLETGRLEPTGESPTDPPEAAGQLLDDRVLVWDPPAGLHGREFYGQPLDGRDDGPAALQLSLVEAAYLAARGALALDDGGGVGAVVDRGRAVEGDRFDRRLRAYRALRDAALVPKTGFKFGADFRVYRAVESVADLGHSEYLVRVLPPDHGFAPRNLALDVRLAGGVRKRLVLARGADDDAIEWVTVERLTP